MIKVYCPSGTTARKLVVPTPRFSLSYSGDFIVVSSGSGFSGIQQDVITYRNPSYTGNNNQQIIIDAQSPVNQFTYTSLNPEKGTVNNTGYVSWVSGANCVVHVTADRYTTRQIEVPISRGIYNGVLSVTGFVSGSLAWHCNQEIIRLSSGINTGTSLTKDLYTWNNGIQMYIRNTGCWANSISGIEAFVCRNTGWAGNFYHGILTSPIHVAYCAHGGGSPYPTGNPLEWTWHLQWAAHNSGNNCDRRITGLQTIYPWPGLDALVEVLESGVHSSIKPLKVLPANYKNYFLHLSNNFDGLYGNSIPVFQSNKYLQGVINWIYIISPALNSQQAINIYGAGSPLATPKEQWLYYSLDLGDSSALSCLVINNELVLVKTATSRGGGYWWNTIGNVNSGMASCGKVGTGTLSEVYTAVGFGQQEYNGTYKLTETLDPNNEKAYQNSNGKWLYTEGDLGILSLSESLNDTYEGAGVAYYNIDSSFTGTWTAHTGITPSGRMIPTYQLVEYDLTKFPIDITGARFSGYSFGDNRINGVYNYSGKSNSANFFLDFWKNQSGYYLARSIDNNAGNRWYLSYVVDFDDSDFQSNTLESNTGMFAPVTGIYGDWTLVGGAGNVGRFILL
jgi:hypothetical protein